MSRSPSVAPQVPGWYSIGASELVKIGATMGKHPLRFWRCPEELCEA
jgi:hypothetical protein